MRALFAALLLALPTPQPSPTPMPHCPAVWSDVNGALVWTDLPHKPNTCLPQPPPTPTPVPTR
jgi:hypothetical protein